MVDRSATTEPRPAPACGRARGERGDSADAGAGVEVFPRRVRMHSDFVKAFKIQAATHGMKLNELLKACFDAFIKTSNRLGCLGVNTQEQGGKVNRERLDAAILQIRAYTQGHPELCAAHHFCYDLPLDKTAQTPEVLVMGINPGEIEGDRQSYPGPTEQTRNFDFQKGGTLGTSQGGKNWRENASFLADNRPVVFTEFFLWSSSGAQFEQRFGPLWESPHRSFCISMNKRLIQEYRPKSVIFVGLTHSRKVADAFGLCHVHTVKIGRFRLVEHYKDESRPWFFTKHWSGAYGFSNAQKQYIKEYIQQSLDI